MNGEHELPIDPDAVTFDQSRQALMIAHEEEWLDYRRPISMDDPNQVERLKQELTEYGGAITLPGDDGVHYLTFIPQPGNRRALPVLMPEGHVVAWVCGLAAARGREALEKVLYRVGLLPVSEPTP